MPTPEEVGLSARYVGLILLGLAVGSATLTFHWIIEMRPGVDLVAEYTGGVLYPSDILLVVGLVFWAVGWYLSPSLKLSCGPWYLFIPLLLLVSLTIISILWAISDTVAVYTALRRSLLLALYAVLVTEKRRALAPMAIGLAGFGLLHAGVALAQVAKQSAVGLSQLGELPTQFAPGMGIRRAYGLGFNPNPVGLFLAVVSIQAYSLFLLNRGDWRTRALTIGIFIVTFAGLVETESRTALLGWLLGLLVVGLLTWVGGEAARMSTLKRVGLAILLALLTIILLHFFTPGQKAPEGFTTRTWPERFTIDRIAKGLMGRLADWRLSKPIIQENLLKGVGAGNHPIALRAELGPNVFGFVYVPIHSVPLLVLAELGVFGFAAWVLLMVAPLAWALSMRRALRFETYSLLWLGPLVVLLFVSLMEFSTWSNQENRLLLWAALGLWAGGIVAQAPWARKDGTPD